MIRFAPIDGFEYERKSYAELTDDLTDIPGWTMEVIGESVEGRDILGFSHGDPAKPVIWVQGNIHGGHEWRTAHWVAQMMRHIDDPSGLQNDTRLWVEYLKDRYSFFFVPSANPDGYENYDYRNANGINLLRQFSVRWRPGDDHGMAPFTEPEAVALRDKFIDLMPAMFMCNHTWGTSNDGLAIVRSDEMAHIHLADDFAQGLSDILGIDQSKVNNLTPNTPGMSVSWAGAQKAKDGRACVAVLYETGGAFTEPVQASTGMTGVLLWMLLADHHLTSSNLEIVGSAAWGPLVVDGKHFSVTSVDAHYRGDLTPVWRP